MSWKLPSIVLVCLMAYSSLFFAQESKNTSQTPNISPAIPTQILNVVGHSYLKQLIAELLYIKVAVYYGGLKKEASPSNLVVMGQHFTAMSDLHPEMIDIYYRAESALAHRGDDFVTVANGILETGRATMPNEVALPFFEGFNYLNYLAQPKKAAEILKIASEIPKAPQWLGHLAGILMAGEGNIRSGLALLEGMYANSQNDDEKKRYQKDIENFKKALVVQQALNHYRHDHGKIAISLTQLIPIYIKVLPTFQQHYHLKYDVPNLSLLKRSQ